MKNNLTKKHHTTATNLKDLVDVPCEKKLKDLLTFPCDFTFKVVGSARPDLATDVKTVMEKEATVIDEPKTQPSTKGTYLSVSLTIRAENIEQVETLYQTLAKIDGVRMVL